MGGLLETAPEFVREGGGAKLFFTLGKALGIGGAEAAGFFLDTKDTTPAPKDEVSIFPKLFIHVDMDTPISTNSINTEKE